MNLIHSLFKQPFLKLLRARVYQPQQSSLLQRLTLIKQISDNFSQSSKTLLLKSLFENTFLPLSLVDKQDSQSKLQQFFKDLSEVKDVEEGVKCCKSYLKQFEEKLETVFCFQICSEAINFLIREKVNLTHPSFIFFKGQLIYISYVQGNFQEMMKLSQVLYEQLMFSGQIQQDQNEKLKLIKYFISILYQTNQKDYLFKILQNIDLQIDQIVESLDNAETLQYIYLHLCLYHYKNKDYEKCIKYINKCSSEYNLISEQSLNLIVMKYICLKNQKRFDECNYLKQICYDIFKKNVLNLEQFFESQIDCFHFDFINQNSVLNQQETNMNMNINQQNNSFEDINKNLNQIKELEINIFNVNKLNELLPDLDQINQEILMIEDRFSKEFQNDIKQDQYIEMLLLTHQKLIKSEQKYVINLRNILEIMQNLQLQYLIKQDYNQSAEWALKIHFLLCQQNMYIFMSCKILITQIPLTLKSLMLSEYQNESQNYINFIFDQFDQCGQEGRKINYLYFLFQMAEKYQKSQSQQRNYLFQMEKVLRSKFEQNKQNPDFKQQFLSVIQLIAYLSLQLKDEYLFIQYFKEFQSLKSNLYDLEKGLQTSIETILRINYVIVLLTQKQLQECEQFIKDYLNQNIIKDNNIKIRIFIINIILFCQQNKQQEIDFNLSEFQSFIENNYNDQPNDQKKNQMIYLYKTLYCFSRNDYEQAIYFINFFLKYNKNEEEISEFLNLITILYNNCNSQEFKLKFDQKFKIIKKTIQ